MVSSFNENELIDILLYEYDKSNYQKILENEINIIVNYNTIGENQFNGGLEQISNIPVMRATFRSDICFKL